MADVDLVRSTVQGLGSAGAAILVLLTTVSGLAGVIAFLFRQNGNLNSERRGENAAVVKLLADNNAAMEKFAVSMRERNKATQDLAEAITAQAQAFEMVNQRVAFYHEANTEKLRDLRDVVAASADALRVNTGMVTDVRNGNSKLVSAADELKVKLEGLARRRAR
jgi:hypothetical protein